MFFCVYTQLETFYRFLIHIIFVNETILRRLAWSILETNEKNLLNFILFIGTNNLYKVVQYDA